MDDEKKLRVKESLLLYSTNFVLYVENELDIMTKLKNGENDNLDDTLFFKSTGLTKTINKIATATASEKSNSKIFNEIKPVIKAIGYVYNEIKNAWQESNVKEFLGKCEKLMTFRERNRIKFRNMLIRGAFDIFQSFENIFITVKESGYTHENAIIKLAKCSAMRAIEYLMYHSHDLVNQSISQAIKGGYSDKSFQLELEDGRKISNPKKIFSKPGIVILHENSPTYFELKNESKEKRKKEDNVEKYGFRRLLHWEPEKNVSLHYSIVQNLKKSYVYVLSSSNVDIEVDIISKEIYKKINKSLTKKTLDIEIIRNYGREEKWTEKISEHFNKNQNVVISGPSGVGKSTLAYKFAEIYEGDAFWFDAGEEVALWKSVTNFCKEMKNIELKEDGEERSSLRDIFNDIYNNIKEKRTLFIFDNVSSYSAIEDVLPINLGMENFNILITSTNAKSGEWDDKSITIREIELEYFSKIESKNVLKQILEIDDNSQDHDLEIFGEKMKYFPVALVNAASDWKKVKEDNEKREKITIHDYLKKIFPNQDFDWEDKMKSLFESQARNLNEQNEVEKKGLKMWKMMSYFSWNQIPEKIFTQYLANGDVQMQIQICKVLETYSRVTLSDGMLSMNEWIQKISRQVFINSEEITLHEILDQFLKMKMIKDKDDKDDEDAKDDKDDLMEYISHIMSVWEYACNYDKLIEEFIATCLTINLKISNNKESQNVILDDQYGSFLYLIVKYGKLETMKIVLEKINIKYDITKYNTEKQENELNCPLFRRTKTDRKSLLHYAVESGKKEVVKLLLKYMPNDINLKNNIKHTPLHLAVKNGFKEIVDVLLDYKADLEIQTTHGYTALHYAANLGNVKIVQSLLDKSADINSKTTFAFTPLHMAVKKGFKEIVDVLLDNNADVHIQTTRGYTALHYAANLGNVKIVQCLLDKSAKINSKTTFAFTPLHFASKRGFLDVVEMLSKVKNIEIDAVTTDKNTPIHLAISDGHHDVAAYLLSKGSNPNLQNENGFAAIHVAACKDDLKAVNMLLAQDNINLTLKTTQNEIASDLTTRINVRDAIESRMSNMN